MKDADVKVRNAYIRLIEQHLRVAGKARLVPRRGHAQLAKKVFSFEKSLAFIFRPPEKLRKPEENYNPVNISDLPEALSFKKYLEVAGINVGSVNDTVIVGNVKYVNEVAAMMARVEKNLTWRNAAKGYLAFHLLRHMAANGVMGSDLYNKNFVFKQLVYGVKRMPEKWKRCQGMTINYVGDVLGAAFVHKHFSEKNRKVAEDLAVKITRSFGDSLDRLDWMDEETRAAAKKKLKAINWKVGYTKRFDTYPGLKISKRDTATTSSRPCGTLFDTTSTVSANLSIRRSGLCMRSRSTRTTHRRATKWCSLLEFCRSRFSLTIIRMP